MRDKASFYRTLSRMITNKTKTREQFEVIIATWSANGWLEDDETALLLAQLDTVFGTT